MNTAITQSTRRSRLRRVEQPLPTPVTSTRMRAVKTSLRERFSHEWAAVPSALIYRAVDEAELIAVAAGFPELLFPELAAEYVRRLTQD